MIMGMGPEINLVPRIQKSHCPWQHKIVVETLGGVYCRDSKWLALPERSIFYHLGPYSHRAILIDV